MNMKKFLTVLILGIAAFAVSCSESESEKITKLLVIPDELLAITTLKPSDGTPANVAYTGTAGLVDGEVNVSSFTAANTSTAAIYSGVTDAILALVNNASIPLVGNDTDATVVSLKDDSDGSDITSSGEIADLTANLTIRMYADDGYVFENEKSTKDIVVTIIFDGI